MTGSFFQNIGFVKLCWSLILLTLLLPTFFIQKEKYPDWGDDFAQYIYQAQQIHSPSGTYKQVLNVEEYSSPKRSVFFSLALSFIEPGHIIQDYLNVISICYILAGLCLFLFLSRHFSYSISLVGSLCVFYNFLFLRLKSEVVPEFLFIALFYTILYLTESSNKRLKYLIPVLLGLLVSTRFVGLSLVIAYVVYILIKKEQSLKQKLKDVVICVLIILVISTGINYLFLNGIKNQEVKLYGGVVSDNYRISNVFENISIYSRYFVLFFEQEVPFWVNYLLKFSAIALSISGFIVTIKTRFTILHSALIIYLLFLFIYPYNGDTIKYLTPIFPLLLYFIIKGVQEVLTLMRLKNTKWLVVGFLSIFLLSNSKTIWLAMHQRDMNIGPYDVTVLKDFEEIQKRVRVEESIAFGKPFVVNLLADRHSFFLSKENHECVFATADYFLSPKQKINELYPKIVGIRVAKGDTLELANFYLIRLSKNSTNN